MKLLKIVTILGGVVLGLGVAFMTSSTQAESKGESSTLPIAVPEGMILAEVKEERPALAEFVMESDYVVIATTQELKPIPKKDRNPPNSKEFDMNEWGVGTLYPLKIERLLFSKEASDENKDIGGVTVSKLQVLIKTGIIGEGLISGNKYLLFLKEISKNDNLLNTLEIDKNQPYYQIFVGSQSIFPGPSDRMHGGNNRGEINLTERKNSKLVRNIEAFCEALATGDANLRTQKLQRLTEVSDESLRSNAEFALKRFSN